MFYLTTHSTHFIYNYMVSALNKYTACIHIIILQAAFVLS